MTESLKYKKKLIEVAMPLNIISKAASEEKTIRQGHPSTLHIWWSRKPLSSSKAVILASLIDDPSTNTKLNEKEIKNERKNLFKYIEEVTKWDAHYKNSPKIRNLSEQIFKKFCNNVVIVDPFCGGGSIPLAAQMLGLNAKGLDVNPVAALISKALVEFPAELYGCPSLTVTDSGLGKQWDSLNGFLIDLKYWAQKIEQKTKNEISFLYPVINGESPIAYIWTRAIKCPNPACQKETPLLNSKILSKKNSKAIKLITTSDSFTAEVVDLSQIDSTDGTIGRNGATCIHCQSHIDLKYIRKYALSNGFGVKALAMVTAGKRTKNYRTVKEDKLINIDREKIDWMPDFELPILNKRDFKTPNYGLKKYSDLFTNRQLFTLVKLAENIREMHKEILVFAQKKIEHNPDIKEIINAELYSKLICTYLALAFDKVLDYNSSLCSWNIQRDGIRNTFGKQALPMIWTFAETYPFNGSTGDWLGAVNWISKVLRNLPITPKGCIQNLDSSVTLGDNSEIIVSTDPPYYDNICYGDLSDFFYIWLRRILGPLYPDLFGTLLTPKNEEITAMSYRFNGDKQKARENFTIKLEKSFKIIKEQLSNDYPMTIYYAFKQQEIQDNEDSEITISSTGWESILQSLINAGYIISGTWPIRTEMVSRQLSIGSNALTSSILIVCRVRSELASLSTRRDFIKELKKEFPPALKNLQDAGIAPVDMAQSAIGPGMAVFSSFSKILEADGNPMTIKTALQIINQELDSYLVEQESEMDSLTRFCIAWFEQFGWNEGSFGDANTLATAKGTAVNALEQAGIVFAKAGKVRLLKRNELQQEWDPITDKRLTVWECVQYLIRKLEIEGEAGAANILKKIGGLSEPVKDLAYRLYSLCEKKGWAEDALAYNSLISSWQSVADKAQFAAGIDEATKKRLKDKSQRTLGEQWSE
ncbi:MAG: DUF1156 domain-containing protein [Actinobacteria bacterium]|nr:DUF1156 domain-containing protein [Actinomycetota bacterium]MBE3122675.1 DUF1156 domain-containing protein [Thermoplasmata archaeon]